MDTTPSPQEQVILTIIGDRIALGPQRRDLAALVQRWLNDFAVLAPLGAPLRPLTYEAELKQYEATDAAPDQVWFTIYEHPALRPLGIAGLKDIDHAHRTAEFTIFIGEQDAWGKGCGTETTRLVVDYGFTGLGLHNIMLRVFSFNVRGIRAYTRAGFREIGRRREAFRLGGAVYDTILMDCLATEFESPVLHRLLVFHDQ